MPLLITSFNQAMKDGTTMTAFEIAQPSKEAVAGAADIFSSSSDDDDDDYEKVCSSSSDSETLSLSSWTAEDTSLKSCGESLLCDIKDYDYRHLHRLELEVVDRIVAKRSSSSSHPSISDEDTATRKSSSSQEVKDPDFLSAGTTTRHQQLSPKEQKDVTMKKGKKKRDIFKGLKTKYGKEKRRSSSNGSSYVTSSSSSLSLQDSILKSWKRRRSSILSPTKTRKRNRRRSSARKKRILKRVAAGSTMFVFLVLMGVISSMLFQDYCSCRSSFPCSAENVAHHKKMEDDVVEDPVLQQNHQEDLSSSSLPSNSILKGLYRRRYEAKQRSLALEKQATKTTVVKPKRRKSLLSFC